MKVLQARDVAPAAHHVFAAGPLDHPPTDVAVGLLHGGQHIVESDSVRGKLGRIDLDLVLLLESADRGDFRDSRHGPKPVGEIPVLERPQVGERVPAGLVHEDILEAPADARGIGAQVGVDVLRKLSLNSAKPKLREAPNFWPSVRATTWVAVELAGWTKPVPPRLVV